MGNIYPLTWYQNTWELDGFSDVVGAPFTLEPRPYSATLVGTDLSCFGGGGVPDGEVVLTITNGISSEPPEEIFLTTGVR